ncbi:HPP family protein [Flammeovirga kamogawensis]|uniref:HPP family protein n=1 Tax=Flammeovirga kamogawensis TaxID=373891 RepID=A0ABX8H2N4_9BACT|nr:HPP family protein [Flammeovirga kamogawensis]MBB6460150.1 CBS-domain-containing membrane protein [Flammeovirga kamogawensis]QWG09963.1 HPP family protein [Flammeovirga kamogawensis]TRX65470.1 HPP family protein [Flammeovirga kamogawensis]
MKIKKAALKGFNSFIGIGVLCILQMYFKGDFVLLTGAFGATSVLLFAAPESPLAQRKNMYCGHLVSAIVGVTCYKILFDLSPEFAVASSVGLSIFLMSALNILHPPGGATAYIAVYGNSTIHELGYAYVFIPVLIGIFLLDNIQQTQTKLTDEN